MSEDRITLRLYRQHRESLVSYAGSLSGDRSAAEDVVQDAWLLMNRAESDAIREPLSYLRRIIRNLVFAKARDVREKVVAVDTLAEVVDERPTIETELMARQAMALVMAAIEAMPARQQAAIKLYHFENLKLREVADRLGLSVSHTHRLIAEGMESCDRQRRRSL